MCEMALSRKDSKRLDNQSGAPSKLRPRRDEAVYRTSPKCRGYCDRSQANCGKHRRNGQRPAILDTPPYQLSLFRPEARRPHKTSTSLRAKFVDHLWHPGLRQLTSFAHDAPEGQKTVYFVALIDDACRLNALKIAEPFQRSLRPAFRAMHTATGSRLPHRF